MNEELRKAILKEYETLLELFIRKFETYPQLWYYGINNKEKNNPNSLIWKN